MPSSATITAILAAGFAIAFAVSPLFVTDFAGFRPDQFPVPQIDPPVQPAGYAFAIWGVIYLWLVAGMIWGLLRARDDGPWHDMRIPLVFSLAVGSVWLSVAVLSPIWATVLIWIMLVSALTALFRAPRADWAWAAGPVGLYAGWLSAASCVALGLLAGGYGLVDEQTAALVFVALASAIGATVQALLRVAPTYGIAVIWALVAVIVQNFVTAPIVALVAAAGCLIVAFPTFRAAQMRAA